VEEEEEEEKKAGIFDRAMNWVKNVV